MIGRVTSHPNISIHFDVDYRGSGRAWWATLPPRSPIKKSSNTVLWFWPSAPSPYRPEGEYLYNQNPNVMLSLDMDAEIMGQTERLKNAQGVAFIQCVGSRIPERPYCNKVCCAHSVENAIKLKTLYPDQDVYILFRDMRTYGERELLYQKARELGVVFIHYRLADLPQVEEADGRLKITVLDQVLRRPVTLRVDLLTLATAIIPHHNAPAGGTLQGAFERRGLFHRGPRQDQAGGGLHRRDLPDRAVPLSQAHPGVRGRSPGLRLPGHHRAVQGHRC